MRTIERARQILAHSPEAAMADALGLAAVVVVIFVGFLAPALV